MYTWNHYEVLVAWINVRVHYIIELYMINRQKQAIYSSSSSEVPMLGQVQNSLSIRRLGTNLFAVGLPLTKYFILFLTRSVSWVCHWCLVCQTGGYQLLHLICCVLIPYLSLLTAWTLGCIVAGFTCTWLRSIIFLIHSSHFPWEEGSASSLESNRYSFELSMILPLS